MKSIVSSQMPICNDPTQYDIGVFPDKEQEEQLDAIAMVKGWKKWDSSYCILCYST